MTKVNVVMEENNQHLTLIKATNGVVLNLAKNQFQQTVDVEDELKKGQMLYVLIKYTDDDSYVTEASIHEDKIQQKYEQSLAKADHTFEIQSIEYKQTAV